MRRLSIIDLDTGRQPIANEDGSVVVVFNGEIYNYRELRERLLSRGHTLRTRSDTETLVHLYEDEGPGFLRRLNGMFALALLDRKQRRLFLARDRLGIKPLSYRFESGRLWFASEIKCLLQDPSFRTEIAPEALHEYLTYMYVPAPRSIFRNVRKLLPGWFLTWTPEEGVKESRYWDVPVSDGAPAAGTGEDPVEDLIERLSRSVEMQMVSDVPVGAYLSGGLDSSLVVALMSRHSRGPVKTFSIGYGERAERFNETSWARIVARAFETDHHELIATPEVAELLPRITWHLDEPYANSSAIPTYLISQEARKKVKVMLSGAGGDEVFAGYPRNIAVRWADLYGKIPRPLRRAVSGILRRIPESTEGRHLIRRLREFARGSLLPRAERYISWVSFFDEEEKAKLYSGEFAGQVKGYDATVPFAAYLADRRKETFFDAMLYLDVKTWLPFNILEYQDKMSMMASLEARVPLLDHELVEYAAKLPFHLKVKGFTSKYILKKAGERLLPREIVHRRKMGFMVPIGIWLKEDLREMVGDLLSEETIRRRGIFHPPRVAWILKEHQEGRRDFSHHIWVLLMLELWQQAFVDGRGGVPPAGAVA
jgi:asparagine synthase (glutamine-hydrolysing)